MDRGNKFLAEFKTLIKDDYNITLKPITAQNPHANAILERVHQTIGNIIRTMKVQEMVLDDDNPWDGILASTLFALRVTVHTTTSFTPTQLDFGQDAVLNTRQFDKIPWDERFFVIFVSYGEGRSTKELLPPIESPIISSLYSDINKEETKGLTIYRWKFLGQTGIFYSCLAATDKTTKLKLRITLSLERMDISQRWEGVLTTPRYFGRRFRLRNIREFI